MKKIIVMVLCVSMMLVFTACGGSGGSGGDSGGGITGLKASDLNIEDFEWNVDEAKIEGTDCYALSLTNNSKYDLLGVQIQYEPKADVTEDQLSIFNDFMEEHAEYMDDGETVEDVMLRGDSSTYVASGESVTNVPLAIGVNDLTWYNIPDEDQFELMEPEELAVGVIKGKKLYLAYYDIPDSKWKIDSETADLNKWPEAKIASAVPKPDAKIFTSISHNNINSFSVDVYGASKEDYQTYVEKVKEAGYIDDDYDNDDYYYGEDKEGNTVSVTYDEQTESYSINGDGEMEEDEAE